MMNEADDSLDDCGRLKGCDCRYECDNICDRIKKSCVTYVTVYVAEGGKYMIEYVTQDMYFVYMY